MAGGGVAQNRKHVACPPSFAISSHDAPLCVREREREHALKVGPADRAAQPVRHHRFLSFTLVLAEAV